MKIDTAPCAENTTEFEDWALEGLRKAEEMLEDKSKDVAAEYKRRLFCKKIYEKS